MLEICFGARDIIFRVRVIIGNIKIVFLLIVSWLIAYWLLFRKIHLIIISFRWTDILYFDWTLRFGNILLPVLNFLLVHPSLDIHLIDLKQLIQKLIIKFSSNIGSYFRVDFLYRNNTLRIEVKHDRANLENLAFWSNFTCYINSLKEVKTQCVELIQTDDFPAFSVPQQALEPI